ncbi:unnamed protein product [Closterium sp. NIES-53]
MATPSVLTFDAEGRAVDFEVWVDDLQLFLQCDRADGLSLFDLTSGASPAPPATANSTVRSQWATRDAAARLAVRNHLPTTERAHFSQYRSAQTLYDAVVARYSSPATAALSRLFLPYLFPDLTAFPTVTDLITHLRTSDNRYRAALPAEFCAKSPPPMYLTLYYIVTRLPDSLRSIRDHFLSVCPTSLTVDLLEERLLAAEQSIVAVGASRGDPRTPVFQGCSPPPLLPSVASAALTDLGGFESVGGASAPSGRRRPGKGKGGRGVGGAGGGGGGGGGGGSGGGGGGGGRGGGGGGVGSSSGGGRGGGGGGSGSAGRGSTQRSGSGGGPRQEQQRSRETPSSQQLRDWYAGRQRGGGAGPCTYVLRTGDRAGEQCGGLHSTQRYFGRLTDSWRHEFPGATEIPRWGDLSRVGVAIFDLDYDAILAAMYALSTSDEGDCYLCLPPDPGGGAAALGACEATALGASASAAPGAGESALSGTVSAQVFHTFTLDSGASRSFFRDRTTLMPLSRPVAVSLADPSGGRVLASFSTVLPCPAAPSGTLSGLYLPSFSTNLVSGADLQDQGVDQFTPASQRVTHCTCARTGRHLATFTRRPGSSLYTLSTESPPIPLSGQTLLWHHRLGHPSLPRLRGMASRVLVSGLPRSLPPLPSGPAPTCVPCVEGRQRAAPHSSAFPPTEAPLQTLHMDATQRSSQGYTFSLGSGSVSWRSTRSSSVLGSSCEAEIYAGAMAAQELRWLTYLLTDLGEQPRSPPVLYVDNKAMLALCREHRLEHRTKHIALRYFLARELQQRGQLRLAYVASQANTADIFTKALPPGDHQRFCTMLACFALLDWSLRLHLRERFHQDLPVLRLHSDRGDEFSSDLLRDFCRGEGILLSFTLPDSPQQNGIVEHRIGLVMEVARTSMIHAAAPHFLWPFAVQYAAHQLNLWPRVSLLETSTTLRWTGKVGDASVFRFYHPTTRRVFPSQDVTFDESVPFYRLFPYRSDPPPPPPLFLAPGPPLVDPLPPQGLAPSGAAPSTASRGAASGGAGSVGAGSGGEELGGAGPEGAEFEGAESGGAGLGGAEPEGVEPGGAGGTGGDAAAGPGGAHTVGTEAAETGGVGGAGAGDPTEPRAAGAGGAGAVGAGTGGPGAGGAGAGGARAVDPGAGGTGGTVRPRPYFVPLLEQVLGVPSSTCLTPPLLCPPPDQSQPPLQLISRMPAPSPYTEQTSSLTERREPASRPASPVRTGCHVPRSRDTHGVPHGFSGTAFLQGSLNEEIWLRRPPGFTGSFPAGTQWNLWRPVYALCQAPREWYDTPRTTLTALGFSPSTADMSLFLRTDTSLPLFYVLVYVDDLVFATAHTEALTLVKSELQKRHTCTDLGPLALRLPILLASAHSSVHRPLALSSTFGGVHRAEWSVPRACGLPHVHWDAAKRVLRYLCSTFGMGLVLGGRGPVVLTGHADASWQHGQLRLAYVATRANTGDIFTKALSPSDHQRFSTVLGDLMTCG